ncbi:MAG: signal peptidase II [Lentisphaeria bacterium]|jgi:signal peptidase II
MTRDDAAPASLPYSALVLRILAVAIPVALADQLSKAWVVRNFEAGYHRVLADNFFAFVHWRNKGAAWGIFERHTEWLALASLAVLVLIFLFLRHLIDGRCRWQWLAVGLLTGGIAGNAIDRLFRQSVVDFLFFYHRGFEWPAFNLADSGITVGVCLYILASFRHAAKAAAGAGQA